MTLSEDKVFLYRSAISKNDFFEQRQRILIYGERKCF